MENLDPQLYASSELEALSATLRYQRWIAEQFAPYVRGHVIEVGAGIGTMSRHWIGHATELDLVEPAHNLFAALQQEFAGRPGIRLYRDVLERLYWTRTQTMRGAYDTAIMVNVLEHIADDAATLRTVTELLRPSGHLLVFVPALPFLYGSLDRLFGHYRRYTRTGLAHLTQAAGLRVVALYYFDSLGVLPWWFVNRVLASEHLSPGLAQLYDRLGVPVVRALEARIRPPLGKNLVLISRKPG